MSDETLDPNLSEFARALAAASPHPGRLDRDALLFAAGRAAQARRQRWWITSTAALALVSCGLGVVLALQLTAVPNVVEVERIIKVPAPQAIPVAETPPASSENPSPLPEKPSYSADPTPSAVEMAEGLRLRNLVLQEGISALPPVSLAWYGPPVQPLSERDVPELSTLRHIPGISTSGDQAQ